MRPHLLLLLPLLAACSSKPQVCNESSDATPCPVTSHPSAGYFAGAHAHNDYSHARPLEEALESGFHSVEADVFFAGGKFEVSHYGIAPKGTLEELYLAPLQARVDRHRFVHPSGAPFILWVDLKDDDPGLVDALHALFERFPMLTEFDDAIGVTRGPVTVVLTGNKGMKEAFVQSRPRRRAIRDSNDFSPDDPPADAQWGYYALKWSTYMDWDGEGDIPADQSERLACIVNKAHALGRGVRFFGGPDRVDTWKAWVDHGVDFLHTDDLAGLAKYLRLRMDAEK